MVKAESRQSSPPGVTRGDRASNSTAGPQDIPAAELLSFLKEMAGSRTWTEKDLASTLKIGLAQAKKAIPVLQLQGYIEPAGRTSRWRVTDGGHLVSGAKSPRFTPKSVKDALTGLRDRIKAVNDDAAAAYKITDAVAFGDFLRDPARVQAAEVGIRLVPRSDPAAAPSVREHAAEVEFLKQLRGKTALLHLLPYENWMSSRSHARLL
jgi:hypothetical protein